MPKLVFIVLLAHLLPFATSAWSLLGPVKHTHLSRVVNPALVGISLETSAVSMLALGNKSNPYIVGLLNNLKAFTGEPPQIRIGGTSGNTFNLATVNPPIFPILREISNQTGTNWVIGLNFASPTDPTIAVQEATKSAETLGNFLSAFEIGNEPDVLPANRTKNYDLAEYVNEFNLYASAIRNIPSLPRKKIIQGLVFSGQWPIGDLLLNSSFLANNSDILFSISIHQYQLNNCRGKMWNISELLNQNNVRIHAHLYNASILATLADNVYVHLGETNSAICGGQPGASNTFASALWAVAWSLQHAYQNVTLLNFHSSDNSSYTVFSLMNNSMTANPIYYGLLATAETVGNDGETYLTEMSYPPGAAYYAYDSSGQLKRVAIIDFDFHRDFSQTVTIPVPKSAARNITKTSTATVLRLKADSVFKDDGITYGGQTVGSDGLLTGNRTEEYVNAEVVKDGWTFDVLVNGGEGVVVKF